MLLNLAWASGETIGAPTAASLSQATSDAVPLLVLAVIMLATLGPVLKARFTVSAASPSRGQIRAERTAAEPTGPEQAHQPIESARVPVVNR